ncbi:cytochrome c-type biogenesis protein [Phaeovulum vinaykumarii]|uniref:Cytochrome c-type biogenesis protein n=1 Tax=Phaeovulum vinaykumarii TaxID=407234 RepID=A0A1N7KUS4_9RHOB|nr:cytochrome c-type biogenesis protein [Phaeovulum vinaykumarii]SIS65160.1 cytochrome c-type biogenesis protein CcmH [Phaeovulum vinaykumarii]SOC01382.1 cytochrome c-type biogenesis protein CcmH [Phaeovulum vinaykumarii]
MRLLPTLGLLALLAGPAAAVQPDEILDDPALESRARELSKVLRCPVCQGENIDDSNASVSRDLRLLVRERLKAGDSDGAVLDYITDRYGEYVLFEPDNRGANLVLWLIGPAVALVALGGGLLYMRRKRPEVADLTPEEEAALQELLKKTDA